MFLKTDTSQNSHYSAVPKIMKARNSFSVAEKLVTTIQFDGLYPLWHKFIYPGDTVSIQQAMMARLQTQVTDLFDDLYFDLHAWYVPFRLLHDNWSRFQFNTQTFPGQDNTGLNTPALDLTLLPTVGAEKRFFAKSTYDYFGYPMGDFTFSQAEWLHNYLGRAYNLIWNENYRDQNLQTQIPFSTGDGPDNPMDYMAIRKRGKRHDLYTSALPFAQKGFLSTGVQITGSAPVQTNSQDIFFTAGTNINKPMDAGPKTASFVAPFGTATSGSGNLQFGNQSGLTTNLTAGFAYMMINDLRLSASVQQLFEADARGGTRDVESILHRWGVQVPDYRMQRPEYLGGQTFTFDGHVVPSTAATADNPQGHLAAFSQAMNSMNITHSFVEHGVMMILVSCRSNQTYQEALWKELSLKTRFDFYQPEFAQLGEVGMKNKELNFTSSFINNNLTFGYQEYGYWLRYGQNKVTGEMRSSYPTSLDYKHMAYDFGNTTPTLGSGFIESFTPIDRNIVVSSSISDPIQINQMVKGTLARTLPMYSIPGITRV